MEYFAIEKFILSLICFL